jgi:FkbM family methyltransferase
MIFRYLNHPVGRRDPMGTLVRILRWQLGARVLAHPIAVPFINNSVLVVEIGMRGASGCIYVGLAEFEDMLFVAHFCHSGTKLADVGANVGVYSILAAEMGAQVTAIEPVPSAFGSLVRNVRINEFDGLINALPMAVGRETGRVRMTSRLGPTNHVLLSSGGGGDSLDVQVESLDNLVDEANVIKIDVEGFESAALAGGQRVLRQPSTQAILIELNGLGARYGYRDRDIHEELLGLGFRAMRYQPHRRQLTESPAPNPKGNTLYLRDPSAATEKVKAAAKVRVLGYEW